MSKVSDAWERLEAWYEKHGILDYLLPGATADELARLEGTIGVALPSDLRESLQRHNGTVDSGWPNGDLLSTNRIAESWEILTDLLEGGDFSDSKPHLASSRKIRLIWWNKHWIPIDDDFGGNNHVVDLDPASEGQVGQVFFWDHECGPSEPEAVSVADFLNRSLQRLEDEMKSGKLTKMKYPRE